MYIEPSLLNWSEYTILLVEDDESSSFLLREILKDTRVNVVTVSNGLDAVNYCSAGNKVDLILMDIKMPVMNGIDASFAIKQIYPDLPIIAQTANTIYDTRILCLETGCDEFIIKPIDSAELLELISHYLK